MKRKRDQSHWKLIRVRSDFHAQLQLMTAGTGKSLAAAITERFPEIKPEPFTPGKKGPDNLELPFPE